MDRRRFLQLAGSFVVSASLPIAVTGCFHRSRNGGSYSFPQGIASGDPRPSSIVIWTRVEPSQSYVDSVWVTAEVSTDEDFTSLILQQDFEVGRPSDFTLRILVDDLQPNTFYYYRFRVGNDVVSIHGRTLTAPQKNDSQEINFAFVNCQDYSHGYYSAYRRMIKEDQQKLLEDQVRFVLHLGDFIYETINDPLQTAVDEYYNPIAAGLINPSGKERRVAAFPQGGTNEYGTHYAATVDDYRHLYKHYLTDPDLQAARARWPFIHIWDDHEFSDDCWQSEANYSRDGSTDEPSQPRKVAANQAWFEYMPINLVALDDVEEELRQTKAFTFAEVSESTNTEVNDENLVTNRDNVAAIDTMSIYRSFQFGQLVELVLTDNRSYRSDHAVPEEISGASSAFFHPRVALPLELISVLDAGRTANNGDPNSFIFIDSLMFNPRKYTPPGTILGAKQKQWWKDTLERSDAQWKLWGNSVPLLRLLVNLSALETGLPDVVMSADSWDGYPAERKELMSFLVENDIRNVVSLSGDLHAHFAGLVMDDYDAEPHLRRPAVTELVCGAVSSISQFAAVEKLSRRDSYTSEEQQFRDLISYDSRDKVVPGVDPFVNNLNNTLLNGVGAAAAVAATNSMDDLTAAKDENVNSHLRYADTDVHGYGLIKVTSEEISVDLVTVNSIVDGNITAASEVLRKASFLIPHSTLGADPQISEAVITGEAPFPFNG